MASKAKAVCLMNVPLHLEFLEDLRARGMEVIGPFPDLLEACADQSTLAAKADLMVTFGTVPTTPAMLDAMPNLKMVSCYGSGYEGVDIEACKARGIIATHSPDSNAACVADIAMGLTISCVRRISGGDRWIRTGVWAEDKMAVFKKGKKPKGLGDLKMGILGLGGIGLKLAKRAEAHEMTVGYCNRSKRADVGDQYEYFSTPAELASWCDVLAVCLRADSSTKHIVSRSILDALGPEGYVVNISRGVAIDETALIEYLQQGKLAGAGLDVFEHEPEIPSALLEMGKNILTAPYVTLTPHLGGWSSTAARGMSDMVLSNVDAFLGGERPPNELPELKNWEEGWKWTK